MAQTRLISDLVELVTPNNDDVFVVVDNTTNPSLSVTKRITYANLKEGLQDMIDLLVSGGTGINASYNDGSNTLTLSVVADSTVQRTVISSGGSAIGTRREVNFIPGASIVLSGVDNPGSNRVDLTIRTNAVSSATNLVGSGTTYNVLSGITTLGDGTQNLQFRTLKAGSAKVALGLADSGNSLTVDVVPGSININDLDTAAPLAIAVGGTNATTASDARSNLGAAKAGDNTDITSLSGLTTALSINQGGTGGNTAQVGLRNLLGLNNVTSVATAGQSLVVNSATLVAGNYRAELRGIRAGSSKVTVGVVGNDISINANSDLILADATQDVNLNGYKLTNIGSPVASTDAATKDYVDSVAQGLVVKEAVLLATTSGQVGTYVASGQTFTYTATGTPSIDGVAVTATGTRVLFKNQAAASQNGIYELTTSGTTGVSAVFTRALDYNTSAEIEAGSFAFVLSGATNAGKQYVQTTQNATLDTSPLVFTVLNDVAIPDNSVTNAKLEHMPALRVKGTVVSGTPIDLTADQVITVINGGATAIQLSRLDTGALPSGITVASSNIVDGTIVNNDISASAAIALSKLATGALPSAITIDSSNITDGSIVNADINASAGITDGKLATISTAGKVSGSAINSGTIGGSTAINTSGAIATTSTMAVGQSSAAANTEFDLAGTYAQTIVAVGALNIDCSTGNYFTKTINGNSTFTVSNVPASRAYSFTLELTHTSGTVTWFSGVVWPAGTAPTLTTGKTHLFMFVTDDGGTRWRASSLINYTN